jgi:hypothetical protein
MDPPAAASRPRTPAPRGVLRARDRPGQHRSSLGAAPYVAPRLPLREERQLGFGTAQERFFAKIVTCACGNAAEIVTPGA